MYVRLILPPSVKWGSLAVLGLHRLCQDQGDKCEISVRQDLFCFSSLGHKVLCKDVFKLDEILVLRSVNIKGMSQNKNRTLQF